MLSAKTNFETTPILLSPKSTRSIKKNSHGTTVDTNIDSYMTNGGFIFDETPQDENADPTTETSDNILPQDDKSPKRSVFDSSKTNKLILLFCVLANFFSSTTFAIIGPFFPQEAAKKGVSLTVVGVVYSVFPLGSAISSIFFGVYLTNIGAKFVFVSGLFVAGFCCILFGTLSLGPDGFIFVMMCILTRTFVAIGCGAFKTASYAIVSHHCGNYLSTALAVIQTFVGIGYMVGPPIGGALYTFGGYGMPFYTLGFLVILNGAAIYKFLPSLDVTKKTRNTSGFKLLHSPLTVISAANITVTTMGVVAYDATFSIHLEYFHLKVFIMSVIFCIMPSVYAISNPIWGYLSDTKQLEKHLMVFGLILNAIAWLLGGPSNLVPFIPFTLWIVSVGMAIVGLTYGAVVIAAMKCCIKGAIELGLEPNLDTYALVSGLFTFSTFLGGFLGPTVIGAIVENKGFPVGYTVIAMTSTFMTCVTSSYFVYRHLKYRKELQ